MSHYSRDNAKLKKWKDFGPEAGIHNLEILTDDTINLFLDIDLPRGRCSLHPNQDIDGTYTGGVYKKLEQI